MSLATVDVVVVGGGIAGAATAHALAKRGLRALVLEARPRPGAAGSGNVAGVYSPQPGDAPAGRLELTRRGAAHTAALAARLTARGHDVGWRPCGALRYEARCDAAALGRWGVPPEEMRVVEPKEASGLSGMPAPAGPALWQAGAGVVSPPALVTALLAEAAVAVECGVRVAAMRREGGTWCLYNEAGARLAAAPAVVLANAADAARLLAAPWLRIEALRGQVARLDWAGRPMPRCVVSSGGYLVPMEDGTVLAGATYEHGVAHEEPDAAAFAELLARLDERLGVPLDAGMVVEGTLRAAHRAATADRMPLVGPMVDTAVYTAVHGGRRYSRVDWSGAAAWWVPGLYINTGHGSHGLTTAPLAGELVAAMVAGEAAPLAVLSPLRLLVRELNRRWGKMKDEG
jgi:tRNA 5-methylaminomethyl-2-thiouridine biosynthesis bifunctional protein